MSLPDHLAAGVRAAHAGHWEEAVTELEPVVAATELSQDPELADIWARAASLHAQALLELGRHDEAYAACRPAIRVLRQLRDKVGLNEVRKLQDRIVAAQAQDIEQARRQEEQRRIAATPVDDLLAHVSTPAERAEVYIKKAQAHADVGDPAAGAPLAADGLAFAEDAGSTQWTVMARIALARCEPEKGLSHLVEGLAAARAAEEFNLVATLARAARVLGIELPKERGPG